MLGYFKWKTLRSDLCFRVTHPIVFHVIKGVKTINIFTPLIIELHFVCVTQIVVWFHLHI